jgi:hypothetical protein
MRIYVILKIMTQPKRPVGRPPLSESDRKVNFMFRLSPETDAALEYVRLAGGYDSRVDALGASVKREADRLRRKMNEITVDVLGRAARYPRNPTAGGPHMDRGERILRAYAAHYLGSVSDPKDTEWVSYANENGARITADDDAIDWIGARPPSQAIARLESLGIGDALAETPRAQVVLKVDEGDLVRASVRRVRGR